MDISFLVGLGSLVLLLVLIGVGVPIFLVLGLLGALGSIYVLGLIAGVQQITLCLWKEATSYIFVCIPLFIFMGQMVFHAGFGADFYTGLYRWLGRLPGGLAIVSTFACAGFAAITGSSIATLASIGSMAYPEMKKYNYDKRLAVGTLAGAGTLGILIPPSLSMVFYGVITEVSIGALFMAGLIPGIILALAFSGFICIVAILKPSLALPGPSFSWQQKLEGSRWMWVFPFIFLLVIGGIYAGVFTPTEAASAGSFFAIAICGLTRRLSWKRFTDSLAETGRLTAMVFAIIIGGMLYARFLVLTGVIPAAVNLIVDLPVSPHLIIVGLIPVWCVMGMFLDIYGMMILAIPVCFPVILELGFDPVFFGVFVTIMCEAALLTPPVGVNTYVAKGIAGKDITLEGAFVGIIPFFVLMLIILLVLVFFPQICLWLPGVMMG